VVESTGLENQQGFIALLEFKSLSHRHIDTKMGTSLEVPIFVLETNSAILKLEPNTSILSIIFNSTCFEFSWFAPDKTLIAAFTKVST
jgi:hypothetical protein